MMTDFAERQEKLFRDGVGALGIVLQNFYTTSL